MIDLDQFPVSEYVGDPARWVDLASDVAKASASGYCVAYDTETIGCDPEEETAVYWARPVIWSIAIADGPLTARGYRRAKGYVLPWQALEVFRDWFGGKSGTVWAFNARFDRHAVYNLEIETSGVKDVLDYIRILDPGHEKYSLKECCPRYLGYHMMGYFKEVFKLPRFKEKKKWRNVCTWDPTHDTGHKTRKKCECCMSPTVREDYTEREQLSDRFVKFQEVIGLTPDLEVTPGQSELWDTAVTYSGLDAIATAELASMVGPTFRGAKSVAKLPNL